MPNTTTNLQLEKPLQTENYDVDVQNRNMDKLDAEVVKKASTTQDGRLSKEDKTKLDGIEAGATNYVHPASHPATMILMSDGVTTAQSEIDSLKSSVSSGKQQVATAITGKGGTVADADGDGVPSFQELSEGVIGLAKPTMKTTTLVQQKQWNNPWGTSSILINYIDEDNVEVLEVVANGRKLKLNFSTMSTDTTYTSPNTKDDSNWNNGTLHDFYPYIVRVNTGINYIDVLDFDKNLIKRLTVTNTFDGIPSVRVNFAKTKIVVTGRIDSYYSYYDTYIIDMATWTITHGPFRLETGVSDYILLENNLLLCYVYPYVKLYDLNGNYAGATSIGGVSTDIVRLVSPIVNGYSALFIVRRNDSSTEKVSVLTVSTTKAVTNKIELSKAFGDLLFYDIPYGTIYWNEWGKSFLYFNHTSSTAILYEVNSNISKYVYGISPTGWGSSNYGNTAIDRKNNSKTYFTQQRVVWSSAESVYISKFIIE